MKILAYGVGLTVRLCVPEDILLCDFQALVSRLCPGKLLRLEYLP